MTPQPRVHQWQSHVGEEVSNDNAQRGNQGHTHDDGDIDHLNGLPGKLSNAGPTENRLNYDGSAHEKTDIEAINKWIPRQE